MANTPLAKPNNFEEARETESKCVKFAKEVQWWFWWTFYDDDHHSDDDDDDLDHEHDGDDIWGATGEQAAWKGGGGGKEFGKPPGLASLVCSR